MLKEIFSTLVYADIFDYPLKKEEIWEWMVVENLKFKISNLKIKEALDSLLQKRVLGEKEKFYFLAGREKIVETRKIRERYSASKTKLAGKIAGILRFIPWVKLIGITGGLARKNAKKEDDIDLFFITSKNHLWLSRGLVVFILSILGVYRRPQKIKDMICPNMLVSEDNLEIKPHGLFNAHETCLMKPIFVRGDTYKKFLQANLWVKRFLPNVKEWRMENGEWRKQKIFNFQFSIFNCVERLAKRLQLWYMSQKRTTEVVSDNLIKFHPQDCREKVLKEYRRRLRKFKL